MLAAAETDLNTYFINLAAEQRGQVGRLDLGGIETVARQQMRDQVALVRSQLVSLAASEKRAVTGLTAKRCIVGNTTRIVKVGSDSHHHHAR
jgi:hypothetical protein